MIEAHRTFLKSMSAYKLQRYGTSSSKLNNKFGVVKTKWIDIDQEFITVIENYNRVELYTKQGKDGYKIRSQPIFIDLIVKVMLCRVYVNIMDKRVLTAEKILGNAE